MTDVCFDCSQPIPVSERKALALGKAFHWEHFRCQYCGVPFDGADYYEIGDGVAACAKDYFDRHGNRCRRCQQLIDGEYTEAVGHIWHQDCFVCDNCQKLLGTQFYEKNGMPQCADCFLERCSVCHQNVSGLRLEALNTLFHPECFKCHDCNSLLSNRFYLLDEHIFCARDFLVRKGVICTVCNDPILGAANFVEVDDLKYHHEHFLCTLCHTILLPANQSGVLAFVKKGDRQYACNKCAPPTGIKDSQSTVVTATASTPASSSSVPEPSIATERETVALAKPPILHPKPARAAKTATVVLSDPATGEKTIPAPAPVPVSTQDAAAVSAARAKRESKITPEVNKAVEDQFKEDHDAIMQALADMEDFAAGLGL